MHLNKHLLLLNITLFTLCASLMHAHEYHEKKLVVVLGMHRAGTSVVSKGLQTLGVDFGDHLLPGAADNPLGYFEDIDIGSFNETVLYLLKLSCDSIRNYPEKIPNKNFLLKYASNLIQDKTRQKVLFGFKDPRTARNMSLWKEVFFNLPGTKTQIVIIVRNPLSVAQSLYVRNKIQCVRSYYLWLQYYISALLGSADFDTYFIRYERLMENPYEEMKDLGKKLGLEITNDIQEKLKKFSTKFVNSSMQHYQHTMENLFQEEEIPIEVIELYKNLLKVCSKNTDKMELLKSAIEAHQKMIEMGPLLKMADSIENIGESRKYRFFDLLEDVILANES